MSTLKKFAIGDTVLVTESESWTVKPWTGTIRAASARRPGLFRVDNGKPEDTSMDTNGWSVSIWASEDELELLTDSGATP